MASFNKVILIGNMVADPELKTTPGGVSVCSFRIAVNRKFSKAGEQPQTDFIDIVTWRTQAEFVSKFFSKGKQILVCGAIQSRNWLDKEGNKRYTVEVVAEDISFVDRRTSADNPNPGAGAIGSGEYVSSYSTPADTAPKFEEMATDDDLPF